MKNIKTAANAVLKMDYQLENESFIKNGSVQEKKLWEKTYIYNQILKRKRQEVFSLNDHIKAMVYSMLSSGISWERFEVNIDSNTGEITSIDDIFHQYDIEYILACSPECFRDEIKRIGGASFATFKQMKALKSNICKLCEFEKKYGSVDNYYQTFIDKDNTKKTLVKQLADPKSDDKFSQMSYALVSEYLKNVGHSIAKPDRHMREILGSERLACSEFTNAAVFEVFDIVNAIADECNKEPAEVDYIMWAYCAKGYGDICKHKPKCKDCVAIEYCSKNNEMF